MEACDGNVRGRFEGDATRLSKIEIQVKRDGSEFTTVSTILWKKNLSSFSTKLLDMEEGSIYRAVATYRDAVGGDLGEFRAPSEEVTALNSQVCDVDLSSSSTELPDMEKVSTSRAVTVGTDAVGDAPSEEVTATRKTGQTKFWTLN